MVNFFKGRSPDTLGSNPGVQKTVILLSSVDRGNPKGISKTKIAMWISQGEAYQNVITFFPSDTAVMVNHRIRRYLGIVFDCNPDLINSNLILLLAHSPFWKPSEGG